MKRGGFLLTAWMGVGCLAGAALSQQAWAAETQTGPAAAGQRPLESVELLDHRRYEGYIESEDRDWIYMILIQRPPGQAMHLVVRPIEQALVKSVKRLPPDLRAALHGEIAEFTNRATIDAGRMEAVRLRSVDQDDNRFQRYEGQWFTLDSTVDELTTRRMIVRVEQIFAAYRQMLPPRTKPKQPPRLVVFGSTEEYQAFLAKRGIRIQNRACFLEKENVVVAGTELARFAKLLAKISAQNQELRQQLVQLKSRLSTRLREVAASSTGLSEAQVRKVLATERRRFDDESARVRKELMRCDRDNAQIFTQNSNQTFTRLYHESFHAYLENYVYPRSEYDVPTWLNEGLAMVFESGVLEGETLRIDAPNPAMLRRLQDELAGGEAMPLAQLLAAGPANFLLPADANSAVAAGSGRHYVYAWGLAYYLAFEKRLLGTPAFETYVRPEARKLSPTRRFEQLVGRPLDALQDEWRKAMRGLR